MPPEENEAQKPKTRGEDVETAEEVGAHRKEGVVVMAMTPNKRKMDDNEKEQEEKPEGSSSTPSSTLLTWQHVWNLTFCLLAWGFTVANVTMGTCSFFFFF